MRKVYTVLSLLGITSALLFGSNTNAQTQLVKEQFFLYGLTGVTLNGSSTVSGNGAVGSNVLVTTTNNLNFGGSIFSGGKVVFGSNNIVNGQLAAGNSGLNNTNSITASSGINLKIGLAARGNVVMGSGSVIGDVYTSGTYAGPNPTGLKVTEQNVDSRIPIQPVLPNLASFAAGNKVMAAGANVTTNTPGNYGTLTGGNKTYRFFGPGVYTFSSINFNNSNTFIFDFNGQPDKIIIRILNTAVLDKISTAFQGLPVGATTANAASRIYTEVVNNGTASGDVFSIANGSSMTEIRWLGTVLANGGIRIGSGTSGATKVFGAFWAKTTVTLNSGANAVYAPLVDCSQSTATIVAVNNIPVTNGTGDIPCDKQEVTITSSTNITNPIYKWTSSTGYVVQNGNTATPTITTSGTYTLEVSNLDGCSATAQVTVTACLDRDINVNKTNNQVTDGVLSGIIRDKNAFKIEPGENPIVVNIDNKTLIEVILNKTQLGTALATLRSLTAFGYHEIAYFQTTDAEKQIVTCLFNTADLNIFNSTPLYVSLFDYVRPGYLPNNLVGAINSEGDAAMKTNIVRDAYNVSGKGIRLAVISDSYDNKGGADNDILLQDLPGLVITEANPNGTIDDTKKVIVPIGMEFPSNLFGPRTDEGRAMLQIAHDVAPDATLLFGTGFLSETSMANNIRKLAKPMNPSNPADPDAGYGADIINDDVSYLTSPFFQSGAISQAISEVTSLYGTKYFTSAGNYGKKSYEAYFDAISPSNARTSHKFGTNSLTGPDSLQEIKLNKKGSYLIVTQWEDPYYSLGGGGTRTDIDVYLCDKYGNNVLGYNWNNTNTDGLEVLPFYVDGPTTVYLKIVRASTSAPLNELLRFKHILFRGSAEIMTYPNQNPSTIMGHSNAAAAITVAAVDAALLNTGATLAVRSYSSLGGLKLTGETQNSKPDLAGPDGVQTSIVFGTGTNTTTNFQGTSAAAPHIAAVTALYMEANTKYNATPIVLNQEAIRAALKAAATPINPPASGYNYESGAGFVDATKALASKFNPTPQVIEFVNITVDNPPAPGSIVIVRGEYITAESKVFFRGTEELETTYDPAHPNQLTFVVPPYDGNPDIRVYTPPKLPGNTDGQFSENALYFYTLAKKSVTVLANDTSKQYGESLPGFSAKILVNNVELTKDAEGKYLVADLEELGLANLTFNATAVVSGQPVNVTNLTSPGTYPVRVNTPTISAAKFELYDYTFNEQGGAPKPGTLAITPLALTITPVSQSFEYGNVISMPIQYEYLFTGNFTDEERTALKIEIENQYKAYMETDKLGLVDMSWTTDVNGIPSASVLVNGVPTQVPVTSLSFMITSKALSGLPQASGIPSASGIPVASLSTNAITSYLQSLVIDINGVNGIPSASGIPVASVVPAANGFVVQNFYALLSGIVQASGIPSASGLPQASISTVNGIPSASGLPQASGIVQASGIAQASGLPQASGAYDFSLVAPNGIIQASGLPQASGTGVPNTDIAVILDVNDFEVTTDGFGVVTGEYRSLNVITGVNPGNHKIIPAGFLTNNFRVTAHFGDLNITKKPATVTANPASKTFGAADPAFTGTITGFLPEDGITVTYSRTPGEDAGPYTISGSVTPAEKLANYTVTYNNAVFTINKAAFEVTIKVDDTYTNQGTAPTFTYTTTPPVTVSSITYEVRNVLTPNQVENNLSNLAAGTYSVKPLPVFANNINFNYTVSAINGTLIVNPVGGNLKPIKTILDCITVADPATNGGFGYVANFSYTNDNNTDIWITANSTENYITPTGSFVNTSNLPNVFKKGGGKVKIPFDGTKITWFVISFDKNKKTASTSQASSTSSRCPNGYVPSRNASAIDVNTLALTGKDKIYPNPVQSRVFVETDLSTVNDKEVRIVDLLGRELRPASIRRISATKMEVDMSNLTNGQYYIKLNTKSGSKMFRVIKQ